VHLSKLLKIMSASVYTDLNPFNFIRKHFLQICVRNLPKCLPSARIRISGAMNLLPPYAFLIYSGTNLFIYKCSRNSQHYALICTTPLFDILASTCFGSTLPSSGSFLDPSELPEIKIEEVV
jgi:hypothetical protein